MSGQDPLGFQWPQRKSFPTQEVLTTIKDVMNSLFHHSTAPANDATEGTLINLGVTEPSTAANNDSTPSFFGWTFNLESNSTDLGSELFRTGATDLPTNGSVTILEESTMITDAVTNNASTNIFTDMYNSTTESAITEAITEIASEKSHFLGIADMATSSLFIILGIILLLLVIILITLVLVFKKYRNGSILSSSGDYSVTQLKEVPLSGKTNELCIVNEKI